MGNNPTIAVALNEIDRNIFGDERFEISESLPLVRLADRGNGTYGGVVAWSGPGTVPGVLIPTDETEIESLPLSERAKGLLIQIVRYSV